MKHAQLLMQLYIYGLKEENRILRRKLAETIVERDRFKTEADEYEALKLKAKRITNVIRPKLEADLEHYHRQFLRRGSDD